MLSGSDLSDAVARFEFESDLQSSVGNDRATSLVAPQFGNSRMGMGQAIVLDGPNDFVSLDSLSGTVSDAFTVSVWFRLESSGSERVLVDVGDVSGRSGFSILVGADGRAIFQRNDWMARVPLGPSLSDGNWHHVALTRDVPSTPYAGNARVFIDGVFQRQWNIGGWEIKPDALWTIGAKSGGATGPGAFHGSVDDARVFGRSLNSVELTSLYSEGVKRGERAAVMALVPEANVDVRSIRSGDWHQAQTWNTGRVPGFGDNVLIAPDHVVRVDGITTERLKTIRVDGTLLMPGTESTRIVVDTIVNSEWGDIQIGSPSRPAGQNGSLQIVFSDPNGPGIPIDRSWDPRALSRGLVGPGSIAIWGTETTAKAELDGAHVAGVDALRFTSVPGDWGVGDRLVVAGTTHDARGNNDDNSRFQDEPVEILSIDRQRNEIRFAPHGNRNDRTLRFSHVPPDRLDAHGNPIRVSVVNLSRSVVFETENWQSSEVPIQARGHVMIQHNKDVSINHAAFYGLGRSDKSLAVNDSMVNGGTLVAGTGTNPRGRYALHLHKNGADTVNPQHAMLVGNAVWGSPGWGVVVHDSAALVQDNVSFDVVGAHFVAEDGNEQVRFERNIAIKSAGGAFPGEAAHGREASRDRGFAGHGFWFESPLTATGSKDNLAISHANAAYFVWGRLDFEQFLIDVSRDNLSPQMAASVSTPTMKAWKVAIEEFSGNDATNSLGALTFAGPQRDDTGADNFVLGHGRFGQIDHMTGWNLFGFGIGVNYASRLKINDVVMIGNLDQPVALTNRAVFDVVNGFGLFQMKNSRFVEVMDSRFEGFHYGITLGQTGGQGLLSHAEPPVGATRIGRIHLANHNVAFAASDGRLGNESWQTLIVDDPPFTPWTEFDEESFIAVVPDNVQPQASFTASTVSETVVRLDAGDSDDPDDAPQIGGDAANDLAAFGWDINNDGTIDHWGETVTHRFPAGGSYPVRLVVIDRQGAKAEIVRNVAVNWVPIANLFAPGDGDFSDPHRVDADGNAQVTGHWGDGWWFGSNDWSFDTNRNVIARNQAGGNPPAFYVVRDQAMHQGEQVFNFDVLNVDKNGRSSDTDVRVFGINGSAFRFNAYTTSPYANCVSCDTSVTTLYEWDNLPETGATPQNHSATIDLGQGYDYVVVGIWSGWNNSGDQVEFANFSLKNDSVRGPGDAPALITTVTAIRDTMLEGATAAVFRVQLDRTSATPTTVQYSIGGQVSQQDLATPLTGTITIPSGRLFADVTLQTLDDAAVESDELVTLTLVDGTAYDLGSRRSASVMLEDNDVLPPPKVEVQSTVSSITEGGSAVAFRISLERALQQELQIGYVISGQVSQQDLATPLTGTITIPSGQLFADVTLQTLDDAAIESDELVTLTLVDGTAYDLGSRRSASVMLEDNDVLPPPKVEVQSTVSLITEGGSAVAFRISLERAVQQDLRIGYVISGQVSQQDLATPLSGSITIPSGRLFADVTLQTLDDAAVEGNETLTLRLVGGSGYQLGQSTESEVTLVDASVSAQTVVDFKAIAPSGRGPSSVGASLYDSGFLFQDQGPGTLRTLLLFGTADGFDQPMLRSRDFMRKIVVSRADGTAFGITSFDFASGFNASWARFDATVTGFFTDGRQQSIDIASQTTASRTQILNWSQLSRIEINFQGGPAGHRYGMVDHFVFQSGSAIIPSMAPLSTGHMGESLSRLSGPIDPDLGNRDEAEWMAEMLANNANPSDWVAEESASLLMSSGSNGKSDPIDRIAVDRLSQSGWERFSGVRLDSPDGLL